MSGNTVLIVPATVPDALVTRLPHRELDRPSLVSAAPSPVPAATPTVIVLAEQLTPEQIHELRVENELLRREIERVQSF